MFFIKLVNIKYSLYEVENPSKFKFIFTKFQSPDLTFLFLLTLY